MTDAEWFLPIGKPRANMLPTAFVRFDWDRRTGLAGYEHVPVLGPPVRHDAIAAPMSAEARAVLEAVVRWVNEPGVHSGLGHAAEAYARSLTPPDPLAEAREALAKLCREASISPDYEPRRRLEAALAKLEEKP